MLRNPEQTTTARQLQLLEVVTPRTNTATLTATENFLAAISLPEPFSLEIAATSRSRVARSRRRVSVAALGAVAPVALLNRWPR